MDPIAPPTQAANHPCPQNDQEQRLAWFNKTQTKPTFSQQDEEDDRDMSQQERPNVEKMQRAQAYVALHQLQEPMHLDLLRREYARKLFRLVKAWLAGTTCLLLFLALKNPWLASCLAVSVVLLTHASIAYDTHRLDCMDQRIKQEPESSLPKKILGIVWTSAIISLLGFVGMYMAPTWLHGPSHPIAQLADAVIITLIGSTTATILGLFLIAAKWIFQAEGKH